MQPPGEFSYLCPTNGQQVLEVHLDMGSPGSPARMCTWLLLAPSFSRAGKCHYHTQHDHR